jgi:hypothetical protein
MNTPPLFDLDAIRARLDAASPGPWRRHDTWLDRGGHTATVLRGPEDAAAIDGVAWLPTHREGYWDTERNVWNDAEFIAQARQDIPALLAILDRLSDWHSLSTHEEETGLCGGCGERYPCRTRQILNGKDAGE